ncbi:MAG: hypothetical protein ACPLPQ_10745 [Candidatus Saccharicenans sp.]
MYNRRIGFLAFSIFIFLFIWSICFCLYASSKQEKEGLLLAGKWSHPEIKLHGYIFESRIDDGNSLFIMFFRDGIFVVSPATAYALAGYGEGPGEISHWRTMYLDQSHLIDVETTGRLIYFKKNGDLYRYDKVDWLKELSTIFFKSVERADNKWFFAGFSYDNQETIKKNGTVGYFLSVFENGRLIRKLLYKEYTGRYYAHLIRSIIRKKDGLLWVMLETEPKIYLINPDNLEIIREINLRTTENFVPTKKETFLWKPGKPIPQLYEEWELSYSRVENFLVTDKYLVVQFRNPDTEKEKFTLLLYNLKTFALEKYYFINDVLLVEKNGLYYFLENGDPGLDESVNSLIINIYKIK